MELKKLSDTVATCITIGCDEALKMIKREKSTFITTCVCEGLDNLFNVLMKEYETDKRLISVITYIRDTLKEIDKLEF